ncbi:EAL domain-containing protein [Novosphingobium sp. KACC 22771]|uniref:EAL domain-containing protein n=1 Tax=Novosphingobium sp. KACC 22771 TaxID=3025670 RepID=UPI002366EA99|nr:EAL domain-containing protein [Novosphingobium sp. KACC 22771]WDF71897.1 EAL domain-containing protein [Novosphingobium sp. KACC 22771]
MKKSNRAQALLRKAETPAPAPAMERRRASPAPEPESASVDVTHLRRKSDPVRRESEPYLGYFLISEGWSMTAIAMGIAALMLSLNQFRLPGAEILMLLTTATVMVAAARLFIAFERTSRRPLGLRVGAMVLAVVVPMLLYGAGLAMWWKSGGLTEPLVMVGALLVVGLVMAITLSGRLFTMVAAKLALWTPIALELGSAYTLVTLVLGGGIGLAAALRQLGIDRAGQAEQREMRHAQMRAEELLNEFEKTGQGWFWETDRKGALTYVSPNIIALLGREEADLIGRPLTELFVMQEQEQVGERTLLFHLNARSGFTDLALRAAKPGDEQWWAVNGRPVYDAFNNFLGFRGAGSDLTEKRRSEQHATRLAHFDSLTGLANRFQMSQTLEKILSAPKVDHRDCAVFLLDLDRFKQVNDTMGHPAGDALLKQVAQRLQRTVGEMGRVGRLGGDEFKVILPGRIARDKLASLATSIIENLSQPYSIDGARVVIGASVGIAMAPDDGVTSEAIIRNADLALYAAKDRGRGVYHFYDEELHSDAEERRQLEHDLRDALAHGGLELYYQPSVALSQQKISGFEALLRWNHPTLGRLSPAKFVEVAEDTGLITQIGEWALRTACHDLARWPEHVRVAVNVSPLQFANPALPTIITHALASAGVDPARLELEITESVFLNDSANTDAMFTALKRIGVRLALDDFGTGYSSLGYLKKAPFDKIKIDQSFVRGATMPGSRNGAIIASIVSLADALGMETTAEGVETLDELDLVRELGCSHVQGYIFSKPLPRDEADMRLTTGGTIEARGPRSARAPRRTMLRKVMVEAQGRRYPATIRNISENGAMFEGLADVPMGMEMLIELSDDLAVGATVRWSRYGRTGVAFAEPVAFDGSGAIIRASLFGPQDRDGEAPVYRQVG